MLVVNQGVIVTPSVRMQARNAKQSVIDAKNRAQERARRFWMTARPQNKTEQMLSEGLVPSNTAALRHQPQGHFQPEPAAGYEWRGRTWADQVCDCSQPFA